MSGGALRLYVALYLLFLYLPIALLPVFAFNASQVIAFPLTGFSLQWFAELRQMEALREAVVQSLIVACSTAVASTVLGVLAARAAALHRFPGKRPVMGLIMLPLVLPEIIVAIALLTVILQIGLALSALSVIAAHILICVPFSIAVLQSSFRNLDPALEEAAMDLGETRWSAFRLVTLPLIMPGIIASLLIAFTISLDEFIIAFFLSGTEPTLPVYLWGLLRFPARIPVVMALGTILVLLSVILIVTAEIFRRRGVARTGQAAGGGLL